MKKRLLLVGVLALILVLAMAVPALAESGAPQGKLVVNITYKVTNDVDSGYFGNWALDNYNKQVQVWQLPDGSFYAAVSYEGQWNTVADAPSPQNGTLEGHDASGTFHGGYVATFTAEDSVGAKGYIGTLDFGGSTSQLKLNDYSYAPDPFDWTAAYFKNVSNWAENSWGWTYVYKGQTWINASSGSSGDIVVP